MEHLELLERYLFAIGQYLPAPRREDILAELRANLSEQIADREEVLGRPVTEAELISLIREHGRPSVVAAEYAPSQPVVGNEMLPYYWMTLRKVLPVIAAIYAVVQIVVLRDPSRVLWGTLSAVFAWWAGISLGFLSFEVVWGRFGKDLPDWDPARLREVPQTPAAKTLASRIAELVFQALFTAVLVAIPFQPYLILGPGLGYLRGLPAGLSPEWHIFYMQIVTVAIASLVLKGLIVFGGNRPWQQACDLVVQGLGVVAIGVMAQARSYFAPGFVPGPHGEASGAMMLLAINTMIGLSLWIALGFSLLSLVVNVWRFVGKRRGAQAAVLA
jgi:hypothetical protein